MRKTGLILLSFFLISSFVFYDLYLDWGAEAPIVHLIFECMVGVASVSWMVFFLRRYFLLLRIKRAAEDEAQEWKEKATHLTEGLSQSIDAQFEKWNLTSTEKEVALLLVKGLSTKEIAALRDGSERTVRQHAQSIYAKAGINGRAELAAYFLEDLLGPSAN